MKKTFIAILLMLLFCSFAVFAATYDDRYSYTESGLDDFLGFNIGSSLVHETYEGASGKVVDRALQFYCGVSDFTFFGDSSVGMYLDAGIMINIKDSYDPDAVTKSPAYADVTLGLAYKARMDGHTTFLLAAGPEFTYFTDEYTYIDGYNKVNVEKTYMTMGLTLDGEILYRLGSDFYFSLGGKASVLFLKWMTKEETTWNNRTTDSYINDTDGYFGYRVVPKAGIYIKF